MDLKNWVQRALRLVRINLSAQSTQEESMLAISCDLNGYSIRLYSYDLLT